jgi:uncharacterized membrane protein YcaP (DUF421 family)
MELIQMGIKLITGFILLFFLVRIIGKKLMDMITPFHFISAIVLSELLGNAVYDDKIPLAHVFYTVLIWGALILLIDYLALKSSYLKQRFEGKPSMVIRNGQIDYEQLKKNRMNINQLQSLLRQSETFSIREVAFAFIEPNGSMSILKKTPYQKTTQEDFNMSPEPVYLPFTLIRDGRLIKENLSEIHKDEQWLDGQLHMHGFTRLEDVLFAEWLEGDGLFIVPFQLKEMGE